MLELFRTIPPGAFGTLSPPAWPYVQQGMARNVERVQQYARAFAKPVRNDHLLLRLLGLLSVPRRLPLERYYANVDAIALNASMALRMTSPIYKGTLHKGVFYGPLTPEVLLVTDDYFDFDAVHRDWQNVQAVTPLRHAKSDLNALVPTGAVTSAEDGLSVVLVNVTMLAVQYRAFLYAQVSNPAPLGAAYFIARYVLPNMLPAHMELCLFNRIAALAAGRAQPAPAALRHPFAMPDYSAPTDAAIGKVLEYVSRGELNFGQVLRTLPSFTRPSMYHALIMPDLAPTRQVDWALVLTRLPAVDLLITLCGDELLRKNQAPLNQMLRAVRSSDAYTYFRALLPPDVFFEASESLERIEASVQ